MQPHASHRIVALAAAASVVSIFLAPLAALPDQRTSAVPATADVTTVTHVLNRIGFGPRPGDVARVQVMGLAAYIEQQLHPERVDDAKMTAKLAEFESLGMSTRELAQKYYIPAEQAQREARARQAANPQATPPANPQLADPTMAGATAPPANPPPQLQLSPEARMAQQAQQNVMNELTQAKMLRAVESERQLQEVLADFWFNHFNVFVGKGQVRQYLTEYDREVIRPHVLGNFRELLGGVAHSPAMLFYLDNHLSATPNAPAVVSPEMGQRLNDPRLRPDQRRQLMQRLEQQRAQQKRPQRGINENYARELMELHTLGVDGGYTQQDVIALARILTGWTIDRPQQGGTFMFNPRMHDMDEKTLLGVRFPSGRGQDEGERALDLLAAHPSTARHIAFKLAQRFVADDPPKALVDRAARTFTDTKGNLREVVRTIVTSPEFFAPATLRAKVKTPLEFVVSAVRVTGTTVVTSQPMVQAMRNLGMPVFGAQPPTGYSMTADAWVNTGALLNRMNFAVQLLDGGRMPPAQGRGGAPRADAAVQQQRRQGPLPIQAARRMTRGPLQLDMDAFAPDTSEASRTRVIDALLAGQASDATRRTLASAETPQQLLALALGSPEFQKR
jgi:uncharacterized protein (DUF1800 family)